MNSNELIQKIGRHRLPTTSAIRFLNGLTKWGQTQESDPIRDTVQARPITQELVDQDQGNVAKDTADLIAYQQAAVDQAEVEAQYAMQRTQEVQQQAQQTIQDLQNQMQSLSTRTQQAEASLAQTQQAQNEMATRMSQLEQENVSAGQAAVDARTQAYQATRQHQQLMDSILQWKGQLGDMLDNDPIQMEQRAQAMQQMQQEQEQTAMMQQQGLPPEAAAGGVDQMAQAQGMKQASQSAMIMLAFPKLAAKKSFNPTKVVRRAAKQLTRAAGAHPAITVAVGSSMVGGGLLSFYLAKKRELEQERLRNIAVRQAVEPGNLPPRLRPARH